MYKKSIACFITLSVIIIFAFGCSKKKDECTSAKCSVLMKKSWVYDAEAVRTEALTQAGKASGIKNLKDIKLKKDVKKMADYVSAKSLYFGYGKGKYSHRLVCAVTQGKGFLKSKRTGYWKLNDDGTKLSMEIYGQKVEKIIYQVKELSDNKLVIIKDDGKSTVPEVYTTK